MHVVAACASAEDALALLESVQPDVMLSDLGLPAMSGVELIRKARAAWPALDIVVLTVSEDREAVFAALKAGANGYIVKGATPRELVEAISALRDGGAPMSPKIARLVVKTFHDTPPPDEFLLSTRERGVLTGIQEGRSYKEIAAGMNISPHTVHSHIKHIYEKLQATESAMPSRKRGAKAWSKSRIEPRAIASVRAPSRRVLASARPWRTSSRQRPLRDPPKFARLRRCAGARRPVR
jgi:two-component system NarL family response regulator